MVILEIWESNLSKLRNLAFAVLLDHSVLEDVLQEAYSRVLKSRKRFQTEAEALNYLKRSVVNTSIDLYRQRKRQWARFETLPEGDGLGCLADSRQPDPLTLLIGKEEESADRLISMRVQESLQALPIEQRDAIRLLVQRERSVNLTAVCKETGIPYSTLRSRMLAGLGRIRHHLRQQGFSAIPPES